MKPLIVGALVTLLILGTAWLDKAIRHRRSDNATAANQPVTNGVVSKRPSKPDPWAEQLSESKAFLEHAIAERKRIQESDTIKRRDEWLEALAFHLQETMDRLEAKKIECGSKIGVGDGDAIRQNMQELMTSILDEARLFKAERDYAQWHESNERLNKDLDLPDTPLYHEYMRLKMTGQLEKMSPDEVMELKVRVNDESYRNHWDEWYKDWLRSHPEELDPDKR